jgi:hypothetical protein
MFGYSNKFPQGCQVLWIKNGDKYVVSSNRRQQGISTCNPVLERGLKLCYASHIRERNWIGDRNIPTKAQEFACHS